MFAEVDWHNCQLYRVDMGADGLLARQYFGAARDRAARMDEQRNGTSAAAAFVRGFGGPRLPVPIEVQCEGYQGGRIREMLLVADTIATEGEEERGATLVRGGPWVRTRREEWTDNERAALAFVQGIAARVRALPAALGACDRPLGSGWLAGFPAETSVKVEDLLALGSGNPWRDLGVFIDKGRTDAPPTPSGSLLLFGHVTLERSAARWILRRELGSPSYQMVIVAV